MEFPTDALAAAMNVDSSVVAGVVALNRDAVAENVAVTATGTAHFDGGMLNTGEAVATLAALDGTDWSNIEDEDRATAAVYFLRLLGDIGVRVNIEAANHAQ